MYRSGVFAWPCRNLLSPSPFKNGVSSSWQGILLSFVAATCVCVRPAACAGDVADAGDDDQWWIGTRRGSRVVMSSWLGEGSCRAARPQSCETNNRQERGGSALSLSSWRDGWMDGWPRKKKKNRQNWDIYRSVSIQYRNEIHKLSLILEKATSSALLIYFKLRCNQGIIIKPAIIRPRSLSINRFNAALFFFCLQSEAGAPDLQLN